MRGIGRSRLAPRPVARHHTTTTTITITTPSTQSTLHVHSNCRPARAGRRQIGVATTAYNAIKRGFQVGKEIEGMSKDLGRWMGAIQEVKEGHNKAKGRSFGSVEEEALESFAALKKAQQMENELRNFVNMHYGPNAWNEVIRIQVNIRKKKRKQ